MDSGMKKKSLAHKTLMQFVVCTAVIFVLMAPLLYLLTKFFYAEDLIDVIRSVRRGEGIPPLDLERDIIAGMMMQFLLTFAALSAAMFITLRYITRRLWLPFDDTLRKAEEFNIARSEIPEFAVTEILEFERLNKSLGELMRRNKEAYRIQKEFTENASHELQTPLAVTRSQLDLLMQEDLSERQAEIVAELYRLNTRIGHLNRNLLLLAKIENSQYDKLEAVEIGRFIDNLLPAYSLLKPGCTVRTDIMPEWSTYANPTLLECLLNNLIVNAIRNTDSATVTVASTKAGELTVSNPAKGAALDGNTVFRRFCTSGSGGHGLGLAIVKAICDFHGWRVRYDFADGDHVFTVRTR